MLPKLVRFLLKTTRTLENPDLYLYNGLQMKNLELAI